MKISSLSNKKREKRKKHFAIAQKFAGNRLVFQLHVAIEIIKSFAVLKLGHWIFFYHLTNQALKVQAISGSEGDGYVSVFCKCN